MPGMSDEHGRDLVVVMNRTEAVRALALEVAKVAPSRELSLAITKLEEAEMWAGRAARADRALAVVDVPGAGA